ncbi:MAG: hypothetical protein P1U40_06320 [Coxiellaceae bacterium]|nr:hypothetical protein [Coxiellaceae bacterium]
MLATNEIQAKSKKVERAASFFALLTAIYGISIYIGTNWYQASNDKSVYDKWMDTLSAAIINAFIIYVIGKPPIQTSLQTAVDIKNHGRAKAPSKIQAVKIVLNTIGSAFASVIYANLSSSLEGTQLSFVNTAPGYVGLIIANLFFHYNGTDEFFNYAGNKTQNFISAPLIACGNKTYINRHIDEEIKAWIRQEIERSTLAHLVRRKHNQSYQLPTFTSDNGYINVSHLLTDYQATLSHQKIQSDLEKTLFYILYAAIMLSIVPFFVDSFSTKPIALASFIGTTVANTGLALLMTVAYSKMASNMMTYRVLPAVVSRGNKGRCDQVKRALITSTIFSINTYLTYYTVNTVLQIYKDHVQNHINNSPAQTTFITALWLGTMVFNIFGINKMVLSYLTDKLLGQDNTRNIFEKHTSIDHEDSRIKDVIVEPLKNRAAIVHYFGNRFPANKKDVWTTHLQNKDGIYSHDDIEREHIISQSKKNLKRLLFMSIIPVTLCLIISPLVKRKVNATNNRHISLAVTLSKYAIFYMAQLSSLINQCNKAQAKLHITGVDDESLLTMEEGQQPSGHHTPKKQSCCKTNINLMKGAVLGIAAEVITRGIFASTDSKISNSTASTTAQALGLAVAFASNRH